ncbi:hypothetical protein ACFOSC_23725 [Streptantibioticus rubrisoli]|uniref:Uncharacterized protein n=1 Tax=Streptantibioticus rubrisoli TaxID=1387313 RepID=A0ABT1PEV6_9ACTN|nr:hypothetical protein [Streptantibioticus rubrisoli]MCQ4043894.1 hypothetical protein [Streptantibioticus rubrisoli]
MNRRLLALAAAAAVAATAALTGCGSKTVSPAAAPPSASTSGSHAPSAAPGGAAQPKDQPISKPVTVASDGRTLHTEAVRGGCETVALKASEAASQVTLTVQVTKHQKLGQMCPDIAQLTQVSTTLKAPLDSRKLVDGANGKQLPAAKRQ